MRLVILGETSSGKDFLLKHAVKRYNLKKVVTYTTRPKRGNEIDGVSYHFISNEEFLSKRNNGSFLEVQEYKTEYGTWYYGTPKESCKENNIVVILDKEGWYKFSEVAKNYSIFLEVQDERKQIFNYLKRYNSIDRHTINELERRLEVDKNKFNDVINEVDILLPQFYDEYTIDLFDEIMDNIIKGEKYDV